MGKLLKGFDALIYWVETLVSTLSLIVIIGLVFGQVVYRYLFSKSIPWAEEVIIALIIVMAMYGAARGIRIHAHTDVALVADALPKWGGIFLRFLTTLLSIALLVLTCYASFFLASKTRSVTTMLRFPNKWIYWGMGSGAGLMVYEFLKIAKKRILGDY